MNGRTPGRRESVSRLARIAWITSRIPTRYSFGTTDADEVRAEHSPARLEEVADDEIRLPPAIPALKALHEADAQPPGAHKLFTTDPARSLPCCLVLLLVPLLVTLASFRPRPPNGQAKHGPAFAGGH